MEPPGIMGKNQPASDRDIRVLPYMAFPLSILLYYFLVFVGTGGGFFLYSTFDNPASAIYSLLVYDGPSNVEVLALFMPFFLLLITYLPERQKYCRGAFTIIGTFTVAVLGVVWYNATFGSTYGQSPVLYSFLGLIMGFSLADLFMLLKQKSIVELIAVGISAGISYLFFSLDASFAFNIRTGIAWQVHELTLEIGLITGALFSLGQAIAVSHLHGTYGWKTSAAGDGKLI